MTRSYGRLPVLIPRVPPHVEDHWFGFADAGRAFHVLVIIGRAAPEHVRDEAWSILDRLRVDPGVRPDWKASP